MRARVRAAAAELNYSPNANAQAIVRGTTTTVGLIVHDIGDPSAAALASGVMAAAAERDLIVTIASTLSDPFVEIRHVEALAQSARQGGHPRRVPVQRCRSPPSDWPRNCSASRSAVGMWR